MRRTSAKKNYSLTVVGTTDSSTSPETITFSTVTDNVGTSLSASEFQKFQGGVIAGSVVGAIVFIALIVGGVVYYRRMQSNKI